MESFAYPLCSLRPKVERAHSNSFQDTNILERKNPHIQIAHMLQNFTQNKQVLWTLIAHGRFGKLDKVLQESDWTEKVKQVFLF